LKGRLTGIVEPRRRASWPQWIALSPQAEPLFQRRFDGTSSRFFKRYDCSFSLGDSLRVPAARHDASWIAATKILLSENPSAVHPPRLWEHDIQVMVEGPGHVPMTRSSFKRQKADEGVAAKLLLG